MTIVGFARFGLIGEMLGFLKGLKGNNTFYSSGVPIEGELAFAPYPPQPMVGDYTGPVHVIIDTGIAFATRRVVHGADLARALALLQTDLDLEVICCSLGGFDTHANQSGQHNQLLAQVGNNLRAFQEQLDRAGLSDRVLTCVFSEFGRRAAENISGGTDHGSAYPVFLVGKAIRPGFHGDAPRLDDLDNGNLKFTTDFRRLYAALLRDFLGVAPETVVGDFEALPVLA